MKNLLYILFTYFLTSCSHTLDQELDLALQLSGSNRVALEAVLNHYRNDSLKLEAARFLIRNMPYHYSKEEYYLGSAELIRRSKLHHRKISVIQEVFSKYFLDFLLN